MSNDGPPPLEFDVSGDSRTAVFVRIRESTHHVLFDVAHQRVTIESGIIFDVPSEGCPILDFGYPTDVDHEVMIDGSATPVVEIEAPPPKPSSDLLEPSAVFKAANRTLPPGRHVARVRLALQPDETQEVTWEADGVRCFFAMNDYEASTTNRHFLERYLPANGEFDQHSVTLQVQIVGAATDHRVAANGTVSGDGMNYFTVSYPAWYSASCPFFLLAPRAGAINFVDTAIPLAGGRALPTTIAGTASRADLGHYVGYAFEKLSALERDFGPFPHPRLILYASTHAEMEYAGAATVSPGTVLHELAHSYFGRSVLPRNGDAGWIDEAIATWYDRHWNRTGPPEEVSSFPSEPINMGELSPYRRWTDEEHGEIGADFLESVDFQIGGRLRHFLRGLHDRRARTTIDSRSFQVELETYSGRSFESDFNRWVFGLE